MRFRVPNTGGQQAADGVGNFFRSLAMAPMAEAQAADAAQQEQAKRSLLGARTEQAQSMARFNNAKADQEADQLQRRGLGGMIGDAAMANGVAPYQVSDFVKYAQTGQMPQRYSPPPVDGVGPYEPAPAIYQDDTASKIWKMLGLNNQTLAFDRGNVADVAKASGEYRDQSLGDSVLSGAANPGQVAQSQAAMAGKPLINNIGNTGAGFNQFTGAEQTLNPGMLTLFGDQGRQGIALDKAREGASVAQAGASKASAANSYSAATRNRVATDKIRQEMAMGEKGTLQQTDQGLALVNPRTGMATLVNGPDGKPFSKAGGIGGKAMTEGQAKANLFGNRMMDANVALDEAARSGVHRSGAFKALAEGVAGAVPIIGENLKPGAGNATNWTQSATQQKVEQAQRNFINAVLRRESGAVISDGEFANAALQYFPQINDDEATIELKRQSRQRATELMLMEVPEAVRARSAATQEPAPPRAGSGYTGSWGEPSGQPRNVTVEY